MDKILVNIPYLEDADVTQEGNLKPSVGKGKPVVLMLQGNFCGYCTQSKPAFQQLAGSGVMCATIQTDGSPSDLAASQKVSRFNTSGGVPCFLGFDSKGTFKAMHSGNRDVASLRAFAATL